MKFTNPTRQGQHALIGLYGASGSGKTYSALLLAKGLAQGDMSKVALIDTESGRGTHYCDDTSVQGYQYAELSAPYTPQAFVNATNAAIDAGFKVIVIDSFSHEWEGPGGVLEMAAENERRTGKPGLHIWAKPKGEHKKLLQRLLLAKAHIILCMRGKEKVKQSGKDIVSAGFKPIQDEDVLFEMLASFQLEEDNTIKIAKCYDKLRNGIIKDGAKISPKFGEVFIKWLSSGVERKEPWQQGDFDWSAWETVLQQRNESAETLEEFEAISNDTIQAQLKWLKINNNEIYERVLAERGERRTALMAQQKEEF